MRFAAWACSIGLLIAGATRVRAQEARQLPDFLRSKNADVERGNERFRAGDYAGALAAYDEAARALPAENGVHLDRGLALLQTGDIEGAQAALQLANRPGKGDDRPLRARAYAALGASAYAQGDAAAGKDDHRTAQQHFRDAVDSLKQALRLQPGDPQAAWNLELALRRQRQEQEKAEQDKQDQQNQDQQNQDQQNQDQQNQDQQGQGDNQDQQNQDQQNQDQQDQDQQDQDQQGQDEQSQEQRPQQQDGNNGQGEPPKPSPQQPRDGRKALPTDVRQALDALQDGEENLERHRARQRAARQRRTPEKDW